ncbi:MAG: DNA repair protein RecN, partial [Bacillota bacterium]|nr:DNA repair protein RecN [Bacillota bacterium]
GGLGCDGVEFLISPNSGEKVKPLAKIASGGELSRIMLAIKCIMSESDEASTYIFDEIDTGVSGRAAEKVAGKLRMVGSVKQTLVITHSSHIAAAGKHHFRIDKAVEDGRTKTHITLLDRRGRIEEIARINSGSNITDTAMRQAGEMLDEYK